MSSPPAPRPRLIDPRAHRFGAALSGFILVAGFLAGQALVIPALGLALAASAGFGTRWSILGRPWPAVRRLVRLGPPPELESELPPRFAQLLGTIGLAAATVLAAIGAAGAAWLVAAGVAALQGVLAITGYCLGCRLYFVRWYAPRLFDRLVGRPATDAAGASR